MTQRLGLIHTVASLEPVFAELAAELLPDVEVSAVVDEALLAETIAAGEIPATTARRLDDRIRAAFDAGDDLVLVTCSSVGPAVDAIAASQSRPVLRIDEAMVDGALMRGNRIGVVATLVTTLEPTVELVRRRAGTVAPERPIEVISRLADGAFAALTGGDVERHDTLVRTVLETLLPEVDVVILAQASMARVAATLPAEMTNRTPILSSPRLAMERVAERLARLPPSDAEAPRQRVEISRRPPATPEGRPRSAR